MQAGLWAGLVGDDDRSLDRLELVCPGVLMESRQVEKPGALLSIDSYIVSTPGGPLLFVT